MAGRRGQPIATEASIKGDKADEFASKNSKPTRPADANKNGWNSAALPASTKVRGLELDGANGTEHWLTMDNFYAITRYNHSDLYAMAVWQLGTHIEAQVNKNG